MMSNGQDLVKLIRAAKDSHEFGDALRIHQWMSFVLGHYEAMEHAYHQWGVVLRQSQGILLFFADELQSTEDAPYPRLMQKALSDHRPVSSGPYTVDRRALEVLKFDLLQLHRKLFIW